MEIINNENTLCFELAPVEKNKKYHIEFTIDGDFFLRFDVLDTQTKQHTNYLTGSIYSDAGTYKYTLVPADDGIMCLNKNIRRKNDWHLISNLTIEEVE